MKPAWHPLNRWTLFGMAASAAVMAMGSDDGDVPANKSRAKVRQVAMLPSHAAAVKPLPETEMAELERLLQQRQQADDSKEVGNVFKAVSWYVPPPPPPPPVQQLEPPKPVAPPLPFTYLGQYREADSAHGVIILANADRVYTVSEGDVIDGTYSVGKAADGQLEFTYLPLNINQSLNIGGVL